jgi:hypothetical protein
MLTRWMRPLWLVPLAGTLAACAAQVEEDYRGEPLAKLQGTVAALEGDDEVGELSAAIIWIWPGVTTQIKKTSERVAIEGSFPANFTITLYEPPPPEAENVLTLDLCWKDEGYAELASEGCDDGILLPAGTRTGAWIGLIAAIDADTPDGEIDFSDIVGLDTVHHIIYFDQDPPETLPATPTVREVALHMSNFGYDVQFDAGYQLTKNNAERAAAARRGLECGWEGLCVHLIDHPDLQPLRDWQFESCVARWPDNPTCEAFKVPPPGGESEESRMCREQGDALGNRVECGQEPTGTPVLDDNPLGLADPLTIELGATIWDFGL